MQPNQSAPFNVMRIAHKEIALFFASPIAYLFIGAFAAITLFVFFWFEAFFARNIADVRPMFEWMPLLLILLSSTLTMRLWSEEKRTGTIEHVHTIGVPLWQFVLGKFLGCLILLAIALVVTLPLPISVSFLGNLDWGPVLSGYLAVLLLGGAYIAIGLAVSAKSDNQIVSLISACVVSGIFYFIGSGLVTDFFGHNMAEFLRQLSTGARFDDITRGVIDFRDLYYYLSLIGVFLALNTFYLEKERWITNSSSNKHKSWKVLTGLLCINLITANIWLNKLPQLRLDTTQGQQYSISSASESYFAQLQEPLLIRGYFSEKTHPLLAPLVPQLKDLLEEYQVASKGHIRVEFVDPQKNAEMEQEANTRFNIKPMPFQIADRYQASIVSSYFNLLLQYGDEYKVLGFQDLIEVNARAESDVEVVLRNPEYDITRAIKTVLQSYQTAGNLFETVKQPLSFKAYVSNDERLPEQLVTLKAAVKSQVEKVKASAFGKLSVEFIEPEANDFAVAKQIENELGFQPMATSLFSDQQFYFYLTLEEGENIVQIPLDDFSESQFTKNFGAAIKRFANGFTKNVALVTAQNSDYGSYAFGQAKYRQLKQMLGAELNIIDEDLKSGEVSGEADILLLASPRELNEKQLFAIDQFLMKGGTVIAFTSPYSASFSANRLSMNKVNSGLESWLEHHGLSIESNLVMDNSNAAFPIPVTRSVGGFQIQEMRMLDYPYFLDIREGLNPDNLITSQLGQLTLPWASPIVISYSNKNITYTPLITSSDQAWTSDSLDIMPKVNAQGESSYTPPEVTAQYDLAVMAQGKFTSYFENKDSPLLSDIKEKVESDDNNAPTQSFDVSSVIKHAANSARLILISSNDIVDDNVLSLTNATSQSNYPTNLQLIVNAVDWSLEDSALLSIRSRGNFNRTLLPISHNQQLLWEYGNYILASLMLVILMVYQRFRKRRKQMQYLTWLTQ